MDLIHIRRRRLHQIAGYTLLGAVIGMIYGMVMSSIMDGHVALNSALRGIYTGTVIAGLISAFELLVVERPGGGLRRLSFMKLLTIKELAYTAVILGGDWSGSQLFAEASDPGFGLNRMTAITYIFSISATLLIVFIIEMSTLLGPGVLSDIMRGRYHTPRQERRLLLFLDMRNSTSIAERIGDLAFHRLLNRCFTDLTEAVLAWDGIVHKYVGDEMIVTWPLGDGNGKDPAGAYAAVVEARARLQQLGDRYQAEFGVIPEFRAILHAGPVVAGEMGEVKREIVLLGDTVNTTAKIEQVSKTLPDSVVISAEALAAAALPAGMTSRPLGNFPLPGKTVAVDLYSLA